MAEGVIHAKTAYQVWSDFKDQFSQKNAPAIFQIQKSIATISQGSMSVASYYTKLKALWDELENYRDPYTCDHAKAHQEQLQEDTFPFTSPNNMQSSQSSPNSVKHNFPLLPIFPEAESKISKPHIALDSSSPAHNSAPSTSPKILLYLLNTTAICPLIPPCHHHKLSLCRIFQLFTTSTE
ncbi:hypothetical protein HPP92_017400 [Vanilla planifolia]|uniref:Retrotransposon gag domain-containing protein n=1 Tax=Vanilla planifolia TaxID=51239 RepID=A0A835QHY8_VANPL|nr:hypothetical protein HPP92_017400 [Vanilla planifolia]